MEYGPCSPALPIASGKLCNSVRKQCKQIQSTFAISGAALFRHHSELGANSVCQAMPRSKCFAALALALTARTACEEIALGGLGLAGRNLVSVLVAFVDYQKNWNASLVMRLGPPIVAIPGGVHPNASLISLYVKETQGSQEVGMASALDLMTGQTGKPVIGMIGPAYSSVSMPVATVAAVRKVVQLSCCATSPALSNKDSYPFFLRTVPPDSLQARALWSWILQFEVPMAGCLYSAESYGQGLFDALKELERSHGQQDRVQGQALRNMEREFLAEEARAAVRLVKQIGSRFIILLISWQLAADLIDVLEQEEMLSPAWQILASETMRDYASSFKRGFMYFQPSAEGEKFSDFQNLWSLLAPQDIHGLDHVRMPVGFLGNEPFGAGNRTNWPNINALCSFCDKPLHLFKNIPKPNDFIRVFAPKFANGRMCKYDGRIGVI